MKNYFVFGFLIFFLFSSCRKSAEPKIPEDDSRSQIIQSSEINKSVKKGENIIYRNATIMGDIDFTLSNDANLVNANLIEHYVNSSLVFYDCTFKGKIISYKNDINSVTHTTFNKNVTFVNCTFQDTVNFSSSYFKDVVNFSNSMFQKFAVFKSVKSCSKGMFFNNTHFIKYAKFNMMNTGGTCNFSDAVFDDYVLFQLAVFNGQTQFNAAKFNQNANFTKSKFKDDVFFNYTEFYKKIQFNTSYFRGRTEFINSKFKMISEFKNCLFLAETKFDQSEISGILTLENSIFYISDPNKFNMKILKESDLIIKNTVVLLKN